MTRGATTPTGNDPDPTFEEESAGSHEPHPSSRQEQAVGTEIEPSSRQEQGVARRIRAGGHPSSMLERFSYLTRLFVRIIFGPIRFDTRCLDDIRNAHARATVVYAMRTRSLIDYLYFNLVLLRHDLPLARFSNGQSTTIFRPLIRKLIRLATWPWRLFSRPFPSRPETFRQAVLAEESPFLFLERAGADLYSNRQFSLPYLTRLIDLGEDPSAGPIWVLPLLLVWDKRPDAYRRTLIDEVFGSRESPGLFRKFIHLFQSVWQSVVRASTPTVQVSAPLDLADFLRSNELLNRREKAEVLQDQLLETFHRERQVIVGPPLKPSAAIQAEVLASEAVDQAIVQVTRSRPAFPSEVKKEARKIVREIAANFNMMTVKFLSALLNPVFETLYQGFEVDASGLDQIRRLATQRRLVLVPSHKSHMDYLILSNVFFQHGLMPPHIAAGANLSFWPLGPLFRRAGAFFLRRSFRGDTLYSAIFNQYLVTLLKEGFPLEFFIEGGRSRTGKLCRPRYGMLSMIVNGVLAERLAGVTFVPISVGYEKIIESGSYTQEIRGGEKHAENLSGVIRAGRFLKSKYGRLYIEFEEAIDLDGLLDQHQVTPASDRQDKTALIQRLGVEIIDRINKATTVTPSALVAMALLNCTQQEVHLSTLLVHVGFLANWLIAKGCRLSNSIRGALAVYRAQVQTATWTTPARPARTETTGLRTQKSGTGTGQPLPGELPNWEAGRALQEVVLKTLSLLSDYDWIKPKKHTEEQIYLLEEDHRPDLAYLRNTLVHFFLPEMLLAASLAVCKANEVEEDALGERFWKLCQLLRFEFSTDNKERMLQEFQLALDRFLQKEWLFQELPGDRVISPTSLPLPIQFLGRLLVNWLESYWLVGTTLEHLAEQPMESREFLKLCLKLGQRQSFLHSESLSKPTFETALEWFQEHGVVEALDAPGERRKSNRLVRLHPDFVESERWRSYPAEMMSHLLAMEQFLVPWLPFELYPQPEEIPEPAPPEEQPPSPSEEPHRTQQP
ncbi:MAG: 1-acyl-sn-glycerol-3-phosphate acyltransferase [Bradymonadales bacterium]|nr:1-acyl-sn-glycerol-3-phosphate acyltransferase [Bradymonadales bacterium]